MSSAHLPTLTIHVQPGFVLAFLVIWLDIVALNLIDYFLTQLTSTVYYRRIDAGNPVTVVSADIPPFTSYLLHSRLSVVNVAAFATKLLAVILIIVVDQNISAHESLFLLPQRRTSTFHFEPSEAAHNAEATSRIIRQWEHVRSCRIRDENVITYYQIAFNLGPTVVLNNRSYTSIDPASLVCLSPRHVNTPRQLLRVIGCSPVEGVAPTQCHNNTVVSKPIVRDALRSNLEYYVSNHGTSQFDIELLSYTAVAQTWPDMPNARLRCGRTNLGNLHLASCILVQRTSTATLVERWNISINQTTQEALSFERPFPGPIFEGDVDFGPSVIILLLSQPWAKDNWETVSSILVADAAVYRKTSLAFTQKASRGVVTDVPPISYIITFALFSVTVVASVAARLTFARDKRPRFNTINGLSSILREESLPTGNSLERGSLAIVGFTSYMRSRDHFGVIREAPAALTSHRDAASEKSNDSIFGR